MADGARVDPALEPVGQDGFELGGVEAAEGAGEGGQGGGLAAFEAKGVSQGGAVLAAEAGDAGETEEGGQGMDLAVATAGIGQSGEGVVERAGGHGTLRGKGRARVP